MNDDYFRYVCYALIIISSYTLGYLSDRKKKRKIKELKQRIKDKFPDTWQEIINDK
jgi:hypothetical protein